MECWNSSEALLNPCTANVPAPCASPLSDPLTHLPTYPVPADNDAPGDALAEELARRLGRERCWRVRWPLNQEDHAYAAEMAGVGHLRQDGSGEGGEGDVATAAGPASEADALLAGLEPDLPDGSEASSGGEEGEAAAPAPAVGGPEALQLLVQPAWYRKDANEVRQEWGWGDSSRLWEAGVLTAPGTDGAGQAFEDGMHDACAGVQLPQSLPAAPGLPAPQVLMKDGASMLRAFLENAEPFPIRGLLR